MIRIRQLKINIEDNQEETLKNKITKLLHIKKEEIKDLIITKKSLDARKKHDIKYTFSFKVELLIDENKIIKKFKENEVSRFIEESYQFYKCDKQILNQSKE
jgi:uncharacterized FAD-dependent dehydrogenase